MICSAHTNTNSSSDWPTFHPNRTQICIPWSVYCLNLRQVTPRLCRLCRQHCQIISLICSTQIGKVLYVFNRKQPYSNHIKIVQRKIHDLSLSLAQNIVWFCCFYWNFIVTRKHSAHILSMNDERKRNRARYNSWNFWNYIDKLKFYGAD